MESAAPAEIRILGFRMHPMSSTEVLGAIRAAVSGRQRLVMANLNLHGMAAMFDNAPMARLLSQPDCRVMIDSMPVLFLANLLGHRLPRAKRTTSLDFYDDMFRLGSELGWRFGFIGGEANMVARGIAALRQRFPGLDIDGQHGFFDLGDQQPGSYQSEILAWLEARDHDILIVGMGMPRQEEWIERVQHLIPSRVFLPTGAYLDYQVGVQKMPPRWMGQLGLEWVYRLMMSPRRLAYRYLIEPPILAFRLMTRPHPQAIRD
jgi:N-acetylglucosaminyldiphosphoundecaprenol N-acetyl-beta-D-mannosaminyltransferase